MILSRSDILSIYHLYKLVTNKLRPHQTIQYRNHTYTQLCTHVHTRPYSYQYISSYSPTLICKYMDALKVTLHMCYIWQFLFCCLVQNAPLWPRQYLLPHSRHCLLCDAEDITQQTTSTVSRSRPCLQAGQPGAHRPGRPQRQASKKHISRTAEQR